GIDRVTDGLVSEGWGELDMVGMMQQMGALPAVGPGAVANGAEPVWGPTSSSGGDAGSPDEHRAILASCVSAAGGADEPALAAVPGASFVEHSPGWGTTVLASVAAVQKTLRDAMPDLSYERDASCIVSEGNQVAGHSLVRGTHTGAPLFGAE